MSTSVSPPDPQTVQVHPDDDRAAPLFADLTAEYDARYGDLFGGAAEEMTRYPAAAFLRRPGPSSCCSRTARPSPAARTWRTPRARRR